MATIAIDKKQKLLKPSFQDPSFSKSAAPITRIYQHPHQAFGAWKFILIRISSVMVSHMSLRVFYTQLKSAEKKIGMNCSPVRETLSISVIWFFKPRKGSSHVCALVSCPTVQFFASSQGNFSNGNSRLIQVKKVASMFYVVFVTNFPNYGKINCK